MTDDSRKAFEKWWLESHDPNIGMVETRIKRASALASWQAACSWQRERDACLCDELEFNAEAWEFNQDEGSKCADAIRSQT